MATHAAVGETASMDGAYTSHTERPLSGGLEPPLAAHLVTPRAFYTHHGAYVGYGRVLPHPGFASGLRKGPVEEICLEQFGRGPRVCVQTGVPTRFDAEHIVDR